MCDGFIVKSFVQNPFTYLAHAGLFALSSLFEALPTVLIEAMALGVPIVSTNCNSGPDEILHGGEYGRLVPVGDVEALAAAMAAALSEPRREVPEHVLQPYKPDAAIDNYLDAIADVLGVS